MAKKPYDREKQKQASKRYKSKIESDPELLKAWKESRRRANARFYQKNKEKQKADTKKWADEHPDKIGEYRANAKVRRELKKLEQSKLDNT